MKAWTSSGKGVVEKLRQRTLAPNQVGIALGRLLVMFARSQMSSKKVKRKPKETKSQIEAVRIATAMTHCMLLSDMYSVI